MILNRLLEETNETYYWLGFIAADGHIHDNKRLKIGLSNYDYEHLEKFSKYIGINEPNVRITNNGYEECYVSIQDGIISEFAKKFNIVSNKTIEPIKLPKISDNLFLSYIAGYIDGDGSIGNLHNRKDFHIRFRVHKNWMEELDSYALRISLILNCKKYKSSLSNDGYANLCFSKSKICQDLKREILKLNLPILKRKWDIIDLDYVDKYSRSEELKKKVYKMLDDDIDRKTICSTLNISQAWVSIINKNRKK